MIKIHYNALEKTPASGVQVGEELLKKAKGLFGSAARGEVVHLFDPIIRHQAMEVAQREVNPISLYDAGKDGLLDALKIYKIGKTKSSFVDFATPFIRQAMQLAKQKAS